MSGPIEMFPDETVITVTWLDGEVQVYRNVKSHQVEPGVLTIGGVRGSGVTLHLPLANIREIAVEWKSGGIRRL